jgi:hypothetical protein
MIHIAPFRLIALLLATVLMIVAATPAKAEALDALAIVGIVGLVIAGIVLVAYLVVANVEGGKAAGERMLWLACAGDECPRLPAGLSVPAVMPMPDAERQSP